MDQFERSRALKMSKQNYKLVQNIQTKVRFSEPTFDFGIEVSRCKRGPNLMRLILLFATQNVLQLILRNPVELPYEFGR